ncbi:MAG: hypothetical protein JXA79_12415 [Deltaproteobacteria bacterium]|nr:hypothetical protein [Deltaproteobacteria bacterium]
MIRALRDLHLQENKRRFPSLPDYARVIPAYSDKTANGLTKCIIDFLKLSGHQAERISVTGRYIDNSKVVTDVIGHQRRIGSGKWIAPSMQPGTADISAVIHGRAVKVEIKIGKDTQSAAQKQYQQQVEQAGGLYVIAESFEQFLNWYRIMFPGSGVTPKINER